jgi:hypothetical protein
MKIDKLFTVDGARSKSTDDYLPGVIPFITNTEINNGAVSYVEPFEGDKVFSGPAICISGLGYATVHFGPFLPKGNGGDSCTILKPKEPLRKSEIIYYAALFNTLHGWRFSFGRKSSKKRIQGLDMYPLHQDAPVDLSREIGLNSALMLDLLKEKEAELNSQKDPSLSK